MSILAVEYDAVVQMIDTPVVPVHQHGACINRNKRQCMGPSRQVPLHRKSRCDDARAWIHRLHNSKRQNHPE